MVRVAGLAPARCWVRANYSAAELHAENRSSEWLDLHQRLHGPKPYALAAELHPEILHWSQWRGVEPQRSFAPNERTGAWLTRQPSPPGGTAERTTFRIGDGNRTRVVR